MTLAYHFTGNTLRDGRPIPPTGETLVHNGPLELCGSGLHGSLDPFDALKYAPGPMLHRVRHGGEIIYGDDKLVSAERTIIASIDAKDVLRNFARECALDVIHLWDAPEVVKEYLTTGDETLRAAAGDASAAAATAGAAGDAASATAWASAPTTAWHEAWAAVWGAASAAAWAAWDAAWHEAWAASSGTAGDAAWAAAGDAEWDAARRAARATQRARFNTMVNAVLGDQA